MVAVVMPVLVYAPSKVKVVLAGTVRVVVDKVLLPDTVKPPLVMLFPPTKVAVPLLTCILLFDPEVLMVDAAVNTVPLGTLKSPALLMFKVSTVQVVEEGMAVPGLVFELLSMVRTLLPAVSLSLIYTVPAPP